MHFARAMRGAAAAAGPASAPAVAAHAQARTAAARRGIERTIASDRRGSGAGLAAGA
jgi:hypothetical protein